MPYIETKVNMPISKEKEISLKARLGKAIELVPGKTEKWLMVSFEDNCRLYFGGTSEEAAAYVEVKLFGKASDEAYDRLTAEITSIMRDELGINPARVYVKYEEASHWGWNGSNF